MVADYLPLDLDLLFFFLRGCWAGDLLFLFFERLCIIINDKYLGLRFICNWLWPAMRITRIDAAALIT